MTTEERQAVTSKIILPTELVSEATTNAGYMAMIHNTGGDVEAASKLYGVNIQSLKSAKHAYTTIDPFVLKAFGMVDMETPFELLRHQNLDEKSPEWQATIVDISDSINLHADILRNVSSDTGGETAVLFTRENVIKDLIKQGIISSSEGLTDDTEITYDGKKYTFKQIMEEYQKAAS